MGIKGAKDESEVYGLRNWKDGIATSQDEEESGRSMSVTRPAAISVQPGNRCLPVAGPRRSPAPGGEEVEHQRHRVAEACERPCALHSVSSVVPGLGSWWGFVEPRRDPSSGSQQPEGH